MNQLAVTTGIFLSNVLGLDVILGTSQLWPLLLALGGLPAIVQIILLPFVPESPRYLIINKGDNSAGKVHDTNSQLHDSLRHVLYVDIREGRAELASCFAERRRR